MLVFKQVLISTYPIRKKHINKKINYYFPIHVHKLQEHITIFWYM